MRIALVLLGFVALSPASAGAFSYDTERIHTTYHEAPATFSVDADGNATGVTVSGTPFSQRTVGTITSVRLQRFAIGRAHWYVSDRGIIWADSDLVALSVYLSRTV